VKVVVGFLHRADSIAPLFRRSLTMLYMRDARSRQRIIGELDQESSANISAGRCQIVRDFLAHPDKPHWLWMVDSDMTFAPDILDRLLQAADVSARPIVGGLCFGVRPVKANGVEQFNGVYGTQLEAFPTCYTFGEGGMVPMWDYPRDEVIRVGSTGAACLLMHRDMLADKRWQDGHPLPWFREDVLGDKVVSEDQRFCIRAGSLGYPVYVDTGARTGHVKPVVIDETFYDEHRP